MKFYVVLVICFAVVHGEKKINLEDIERDNLQSEAESDQDNARTEETKYNSDKTESNAHLQYRTEARLIGGQQPQEIKYLIQPEAYTQDLQAYQQQQQQQQQQYNDALAARQQQTPQQFYTTKYQTEAAYQGQKSSPQISYQPQAQVAQEPIYQTEIPIGNQIQGYQQKYATQKFSQGAGKATRYANVPTSGNQQLFYYPTENTALTSKNLVQPLLHRLASEAAKTVPAYTTTVSQGPKISYQPQPEIQYVYEPQYVQAAGPTYSQTSQQKFTYATPAAPQTLSASPQAYSGLTYSQQSPLYTQPKLAYTQAYFVQPQSQQYYREPAYTPSVQGNSLNYPQSQPFYVSSNLARQLQSQILEQQGSHSISQNYAKVPAEPSYDLTIPQISAQNFKHGAQFQLQSVPSGISHTSNQLYYSSGPKSLLDSYTPSHIIAAQDSERYRERPLNLESGFLPSQGSYVHSYHKKRESEKA